MNMLARIALVATAAAPLLVSGHGQMTYPPTRFSANEMAAGICSNGGCLWFSQGCQPGCSYCTQGIEGDTCSEPGGTMAQTLPKEYRTYRDLPGVNLDLHPWRSPGYSPVVNPCGVAGGPPSGIPYIPGPLGLNYSVGYPMGTNGTTLPVVHVTEWKAGTHQPVKWSISANHGGGYAYRLCPRDSDLSEECFQQGHLDFAPRHKTVLEWHDWDHVRTETINSTVVTTGTWPRGSQWMKNPIPPCYNVNHAGIGEDLCTEPMFTPPLPGLFGAGIAACVPLPRGGGKKCSLADFKFLIEQFGFELRDEVVVPADLPKGDYVLSFRWDSEQTPQVWNTCADIRVV